MLYIISVILALLIYKSNTIRSPRSCLGCGLFGYSGKDPVDLTLLRWLACENQSRGEDSTGIYGNETLAKLAMPAKQFQFKQPFYDAADGATMIIGHTRKATMGAKTAENAHPFEFFKSDKHTDPELIGSHNGQIFEHILKKLCKEYDLKEPEVDSKIIYQLMQKLDFDYDESLSKIEGAMALAWTRPEFNSKTGNYLYLYRRMSRPLHVGFIDGSMYYSSESEPLYLIGCDVIDELSPDLIYTFRNGGLLGVSPVKKSLITTIKEDQSITTWLNTIATPEEKTVVGICGVDAPKNKNANTNHRNTGYRSTHHRMIDGGQSSIFQGNIPGGQLLLLDRFETSEYKFESTLSPGRGKFYSSGNNNCCYVIVQLMDTRNPDIKLPAWLVRSHHDYSITTLTAHNGLGVLEVPAARCGSSFEIDIINPLQPNVIYKTSIDKPINGRVLEVALQVPFQASEEAHTQSKNKIGFKLFPDIIVNGTEGQSNGIYSFSDWVSFATSGRKNKKILQFESKIVPNGSSGQFSELHVFKGDQNDEPRVSNNSTFGSNTNNFEVGILSDEYDKETDILGMDAYTTSCNLDEIELHLKKIHECQAAIDRSADNDPLHVLTSVESYLEFQKSYFKSRLDQLKEQELNEMDEALNLRNQEYDGVS